MSLQFGVNIPVQRCARHAHVIVLLLTIEQANRSVSRCLVSTTKQQARLAKQLGYRTRLRDYRRSLSQVSASFIGVRR